MVHGLPPPGGFRSSGFEGGWLRERASGNTRGHIWRCEEQFHFAASFLFICTFRVTAGLYDGDLFLVGCSARVSPGVLHTEAAGRPSYYDGINLPLTTGLASQIRSTGFTPRFPS